MEKVAIFIDGGYLSKILKNEFNSIRIDYRKFSLELSGTDTLLRTYYYDCEPWQSSPPTDSEKERFSKAQRFFSILQKLENFDVRLGRLANRGVDSDGNLIFEQKGVDVFLAVDLIGLSIKPSITKAFIISNDSDFVPAICFIKNQGVQAILVHGKGPQDNLYKVCDSRIQLTQEFINNCLR